MSRAVLCLCLLAFIAGGSTARGEDIEGQRERFRQAWKAMTEGRVSKAERLGRDLELYPLYPYLRYEYLRRRLHRVGEREIRDFLSAHEDTVFGERLRTAWLQHLARRERWQAFLDAYRPQSDVKLRCTQLLARIRTGAAEGVVQDALPLWLVGQSQPEQCDPAFERLYAGPLMTDDLLWQRIRLAMENGKPSLAAYLARKLSPSLRPWVERWRAARADPRRALRDPALQGDEPAAREIARYAIERLARRDAGAARAAWDAQLPIQSFDDAERGAMARALALAADQQAHAQAIELLDAVPPAFVDARVQRAQLRSAIREQRWQALARWTGTAPAAQMNELRWLYWRARALERTGRTDEATALYRRLAAERDYYGFRAADRLDVEYRMHDRRILFGDRERNVLLAHPGLARAVEFHALGMIYAARREWHHELARLQPEEVLLAAALAHRIGWHDRAILTLARAEVIDDLEVRFPVAYEPIVAAYAERRRIPAAVLFSIIKSESAFMADARSSAGALGLMQLMPATARETARGIGFKLNSSRELYEPRANITLGSAYLRQLLERFEGNLAMAAAAYNAGPHRVRSWQPPRGCLSAEDWIELIPFVETRRYVRKTLFNTAIYEWRLSQQIQPLAARLRDVPARTAGASC